MGTYKTDRTAEDVRREIASVIRELKDPRIAGHISALEGLDTSKDAVLALKNASGFIRKEIGSKIRMRKTPELTFIADNSIEQGMKIVERMNTLLKDEEQTDEN